jgi:hypothetical protein
MTLGGRAEVVTAPSAPLLLRHDARYRAQHSWRADGPRCNGPSQRLRLGAYLDAASLMPCVLRDAQALTFVRQCASPSSVVASAYATPESPGVSRLRLVTENSARRGERRTLPLRHVVGTCIAPSATLLAKEYCHEARETRVGFGHRRSATVSPRKIHQACGGSVKYSDNEPVKDQKLPRRRPTSHCSRPGAVRWPGAEAPRVHLSSQRRSFGTWWRRLG